MRRMRERWVGIRNRLLADPAFQKWATKFPLTRPVARANAARLFDTVAGFVYAQVLAACVELDLLGLLSGGPMTESVIAKRIGLPPESAQRLLKAAASLRLTEAVGNGRFALGAQGAALLGNLGIAEMIRHHKLLYADLADPVALLRRGGGGGALASYWPYSAADAQGVSPYSALMAASQPLVAEQILDAYDFRQHRHLLDIGGGEGAFLKAVHARHPALSLSLLDLPAVADRARVALGDVATVTGGSFLDDALPQGADVVTLVRIVHDHDDAPALQLLRNIRAALPRGGALVIAEPMAGTKGAEAMGDAYFGMYLLAMGSGRPRTVKEIMVMLSDAGFVRMRLIATPMPLTVRIIVAHLSK